MGSSFKRNRLINGNMAVWQRGTSFSLASASAGTLASAYTVDRWVVENYSGSTTTTTQQANTGFSYGPGSYFIRTTIPSLPAPQPVQYFQTIEASNVQDLAGTTVTLSFYASTTATGGSLEYRIFAGYPSAVDNWTSGTYPQVATITPSSSATRQTVSFTLPAGCVNGCRIYVGLYNTAGTATSITFSLGAVQLEVGTVATPYEMQIYSDQLAQCQRYYIKSNNVDSQKRSYNWSGGFLNVGLYADFPVTMRTSPTMTVYGDISDGAEITLGGGGIAVTTYGFTAFTGIANGQFVDMHYYIASAEL
jgi:hypothetical protein